MALVLSTTDGPVGIVTLNRPEQLNALSGSLMRELVEALEQHDSTATIGAMVVTGGSTVFAAGADIGEMADASAIETMIRDTIGLWDRLRRLNKPVIAAVAGFALGGGCELALLCDIIVAAENARFGQPEINLGLIPGAGGTQRLTRTLGKSLTMDLVLSGRSITAEEALRYGLAARVVPPELVVEQAVAMARHIASRAPLAVRFAKEAIAHAFESPLAPGVDFERKLFYLLLSTHDAHEGMRAFLDRRQPTYEGR